MWGKKKVFDLAALERAVGWMKARGVQPTPEAMVAGMATVAAMGASVTAIEQGQAEISRKRDSAKQALDQVPTARQEAAAVIHDLESRISVARREMEAEVNELQEAAEAAERRAQHVESLLAVVVPAVRK